MAYIYFDLIVIRMPEEPVLPLQQPPTPTRGTPSTWDFGSSAIMLAVAFVALGSSAVAAPRAGRSRRFRKA